MFTLPTSRLMKSKLINLEFEFHEWEIIREALINLAAQRMHIAPARVAKTIDAGLIERNRKLHRPDPKLTRKMPSIEETEAYVNRFDVNCRERYSNSKPKLLANIIRDELLDSPQEL